MTTVKYQANIETPTTHTGYLVDNTKSVPMDPNNRDYQEVQVWIGEGNTPEDAYTQVEVGEYNTQTGVLGKYDEINSSTIIFNTVEYNSGTTDQNIFTTNIAKLNDLAPGTTLIHYTSSNIKTYLDIDEFKELLNLASVQRESILDS